MTKNGPGLGVCYVLQNGRTYVVHDYDDWVSSIRLYSTYINNV